MPLTVPTENYIHNEVVEAMNGIAPFIMVQFPITVEVFQILFCYLFFF